MGKTVVLAEKPSVGRELARILGCKGRGNGYIDGSKYVVTWSLGHLVTLATPEKYDKDYEHWRMDQLPMLPEKMKLEVIKETSKQFKVVKELLQRGDTDELIIATDAGREGELVARWIIAKAGFKKSIKRLWISSQTDKAIKEGFANLKDGREYDNLYRSGQCRAEADWLVGLNITRALTCKYNAKLAAGRVQTPTLYLTVQREKEIEDFRPKEFFGINVISDGVTFKWRDKKSGEIRLYDSDKAKSLCELIKGETATVCEVKSEKKRERSPQLYDLTELQRDANKIYKYSAKKTLSIMQSLYERHKIVTYPRTDSRYLSDDIPASFAERLKAISVNAYVKAVKKIDLTKFKADKRYVDNSKVSDHHAIIPTEQSVNWYALEDDEKNVFDLIVKRFLCMFMPDYEYERTTVVCDVDGEEIYARGRVVLNNGWRDISSLSDEEDEDCEDECGNMPQLKKGDKVKVKDVKLTNGFTQPPARYTEASILYAMEHAGKFVSDSSLKDVLKEVSGIGTPATRADILEKLVESGCIERVNNTLVPTAKAKQLIELVPSDLKSPELTAQWEEKLLKISRGQYDSKKFIEDMKSYATRLVEKVKESAKTYKHENLTKKVCPECGEFLLEINGKKGKFLTCSNVDCKYRKNISFNSNARCPECHKKLLIFGEGEDKMFKCACGYRQKLSEIKTDKSSKRDVAEYMKKQKKDEDSFKNDIMAQALMKALENKK